MLSFRLPRHIPCLLALLLPLFAARAQASSGPGAAQAADSVRVDTAELADRIIAEAESHLGTPYRRGGTGPKSFDCSGFTTYVFGKFGYTLSRTSQAQAGDGRELSGSLSELQKGDLLIFGGRSKRRTPGHVGIFIGMDSTGTDFRFIHAAVHGGILISCGKEPYYQERFLGARRILPDFLPEPPETGIPEALERLLGGQVPQRDTLVLSPADRRIILFADGSWAIVDSLGALSVPTGLERIVLAENGSWRAVTPSSVLIPDRGTPVVPAPKSAAPSPESTTPPPPADGAAAYHTIVPGDTLSGIAKKYRTTVQALCDLNGITVKTILRPGRELRVK